MEKFDGEGVAIHDEVFGRDGNGAETNTDTGAKLILQRLDERAIPELVALSTAIGWDYNETELRTVFASGLVFGHRCADGILASSAAIFPYGEHLASIGTVMVNPNFRRLGLGKAVTQRCISEIASATPIMLIATEEGEPMYAKIGFRAVETNYKFLCDKYRPKRTVLQSDRLIWSSAMDDSDWAEVLQLDAAARGGFRDTFLRTRFAQGVDHVLVRSLDGTLIGYGLSIQGPNNRVIGPIVAPDPELAIAILHHLAKDHHGPLRVDVPEGTNQAQVRAFLLESGFENVTQPPVMVINAPELPPRNGTLFAIAAQAYG